MEHDPATAATAATAEAPVSAAVAVLKPHQVMADVATSLNDLPPRGTFAAAGTLPRVVFSGRPKIGVEGIGMLTFPLSTRQAQAIISRSAMAPFGHGDKTVIDPSVR